MKKNEARSAGGKRYLEMAGIFPYVTYKANVSRMHGGKSGDGDEKVGRGWMKTREKKGPSSGESSTAKG